MIIFGISVIFSIERCFAGLNLTFLKFLNSLGDPLGALGKFFAEVFLEVSKLISMQFSMGYPNLKSDFWGRAVPVVFSSR